MRANDYLVTSPSCEKREPEVSVSGNNCEDGSVPSIFAGSKFQIRQAAPRGDPSSQISTRSAVLFSCRPCMLARKCLDLVPSLSVLSAGSQTVVVISQYVANCRTVSVIVWYRWKLQTSPDIFKSTTFLAVDDREPPSHEIGGHVEIWMSPVFQPAQWNTNLLGAARLNLIPVSSGLRSRARSVARGICTLALCTEDPASGGSIFHFESSDTRIVGW